MSTFFIHVFLPLVYFAYFFFLPPIFFICKVSLIVFFCKVSLIVFFFCRIYLLVLFICNIYLIIFVFFIFFVCNVNPLDLLS
jgi:hypothetical protein